MPINLMRACIAFIPQFSRYALVGVANTLVGTGLMLAGAHMGLHYAVYTLLGYSAAFGVSFWLNFHFTFHAKDQLRQRMVRFILINLVNLGMVQLLQAALIEGLHLQELLAVILGMAYYTISGFFLNRQLVFQPNRKHT
jgi:putative flippase GtrA